MYIHCGNGVGGNGVDFAFFKIDFRGFVETGISTADSDALL